jgi:hypothetical protein
MKTFGDIVTEVQRLTGRNDSGYVDRIKAAVNRAVDEWARVQPWPGLQRVGDITHAGGRELVLPSDIDRVVWIMDKTNKHALPVSDDRWDECFPTSYSNDTVGSAYQWEDAGYTPVFTGVTGVLQIWSTGASDAATIYVTGYGQDTAVSGPMGVHQVVASIALVGATPYTTTAMFSSVDSIGKSADCGGVIKIMSNGAVVSMLGPLDTEARYRKIRFMNIPAAGTEFKYYGYTRPSRLVSLSQVPPSAVDADYLMWQAAADIHFTLREGDRSKYCSSRAEALAARVIAKEKMFGDAQSRVVPEDFS